MTAAEFPSGGSVLPGLLSRLTAAGVTVSLKEGGEGLKLAADSAPPPDLLAEVRENRSALLQFLRTPAEREERGGDPASREAAAPEQRAAEPEQGPPGAAAPDLPAEGERVSHTPEAPAPASLSEPREAADRLADLPPELRSLISAAQSGELPSGVHFLPSGLCTDLRTYVEGWAESWPRDREHTLRRLWEAAAAAGYTHTQTDAKGGTQ